MATQEEIRLFYAARERALDVAVDRMRRAGTLPIDRSRILVDDLDVLREMHALKGQRIPSDRELAEELERIKRQREDEDAVRAGVLAANKDGSITINGDRYYVSGGVLQVTETDKYSLVDLAAFRSNSDPRYAQLAALYEAPVTGTMRERYVSFSRRMAEARGLNTEDFGSNTGPMMALARCNGLAWCAAQIKMEDDRLTGGQLFNQEGFRMVSSFQAMGIKYGAFHDGSSRETPKPGDILILGGHIGRIVGVDGRNLRVVSGNHGDMVKEYSISLDSAWVRGWVSMDGMLLGKAKAGQAVLGPNGQPILSMDQMVATDEIPQQWMNRVFAPENAENVKKARAYAQMLAENPDALKAAVARGIDYRTHVPTEQQISKVKGVEPMLAGKGIQVSTVTTTDLPASLTQFIAGLKRQGELTAAV